MRLFGRRKPKPAPAANPTPTLSTTLGRRSAGGLGPGDRIDLITQQPPRDPVTGRYLKRSP